MNYNPAPMLRMTAFVLGAALLAAGLRARGVVWAAAGCVKLPQEIDTIEAREEGRSMASGVVRIAVGLATVLSVFSAQAFAQGAKPGVFADEDRDWGVAPTAQVRTTNYHSPTPRGIPGGKVVTTGELRAMREKQPAPFMIDVLGGNVHRTIAGAFWMLGAGAGDMSREEEKRFAAAIAGFAGGDKNRPMVFYCVDAECWLSYNAALRAIALGYTNVMWYRGGIAAWRQGGNPMTQSDPFFW